VIIDILEVVIMINIMDININMIASAVYMFLILLVATVFVAASANSRRTNTKNQILFMNICVYGWIAVDLLVLLINNLSVGMVVWQAGMAFMGLTVFTFFILVVRTFLPNSKLPQYAVILLLIIPVVTILLGLIPPMHTHLRDVQSITLWPRRVDYNWGLWLYIFAAYSHLLALVSVVIIIYGYVKGNVNGRTFCLFISAVMMVIIGSMVNIFNLLPANISITSIGAAFALVFVHLALSDSQFGMRFQLYNSLKSRIVFPVFVLLFLVVIGMIVYSARQNRIFVEDVDAKRLDTAVQSIQGYLESYKRQTYAVALVMGNSSELSHMVNMHDYENIWRYISEWQENFGVHEIIVTDINGIAISNSSIPIQPESTFPSIFIGYREDLSHIPSIIAGLNGETRTLYTSLPSLPSSDMVMATISPIVDSSNNIVGSVMVSFNIGTYAFAEYISNMFGVDVTVFAGDTSVATTLVNPNTGLRTTRSPVASHVANAVLERGEHLQTPLNILNILPYLAYYFPLHGEDGAPVGMFFIGVSRAYAVLTLGNQNRNMAIIAIFGCVFVALIMYLIISIAMNPLKDITKNVKRVTAGEVNLNIDRSKITTDELGSLNSDILHLIDSLKFMIDDLSSIKQEYKVKGNMSYRLDVEKYENSFRDMVEIVNDVLEEETYNINHVVIKILDRVGVGDFDINIHNKPGDFMRQAEAMQNLVDNLKAIRTEVKNMIYAVVNGDFTFEIDATKYQGDWSDIMTGLNSVIKAVDEPLKTVELGMNELKAGNFDLIEIDRIITEAGYSVRAEDFNGVFRTIIIAFEEAMVTTASYITEISKDLIAIAGGDLTTEITREYVGDFRNIKESLNCISTTLHQTMSSIHAAAEQVLSGAHLIANSAGDLASGAQEQTDSVQELVATLELINQQTQQNATNAVYANELSGKSTNTALEGNKTMEQMVEAMTKIKESSNGIAGIVKTIQDIAFQTNLLALNASVEAARAGEQGRGFSVVAEEVRTLAERSRVAADETTFLIQDSISRVENGSNMAGATAESLNAIVVSAGEVLEIINAISTASNEQAEALTNFSAGIEQISRVTQDNSSVSEETATASEELNSQAETLKQLVSYFKL